MSGEQREAIREAVKSAIDERVGEFFVERERHYKHHQFIESVIATLDKVRDASIATLVRMLWAAVIMGLVAGFVWWFKVRG